MIFIDQLKRSIEINKTPKRIVSVVPSQSELLWDLGLQSELVGITKFCIHPSEMFRNIEKVGGTKKLNLEKIKALQPDIIIANKEENDEQQIKELAKEFPVWISDIHNLEEALQMIELLGKLFNRKEKAVEFTQTINQSFQQLNASTYKKVAYFIWNEPMMLAGKNTFIDDLLKRCGFQNVFSFKESRYPQTTGEELKKLSPEIILLSSEPFPFKQKHQNDFQQLLPNAKVLIVDGELFSWYGSRLTKSAEYLKEVQKEIKQ